jgi:ribosomal protein S18 acetylase RimI-like enzyme
MLLLNREGIGTREARSTFGLSSFDVSSERRTLEVRIRPYSKRDRSEIRQLCSDTGFLGNPIDPIFRDRELFADLFTGAYLRHEPDWAFVAEAEGRVVGYLLGSVHKNFDFVLMRNGFPIASKMLCKLLSGRYAYHPRSGAFVRWLLRSGRQEQPKHPANAAHLHLDLDNRYRGRGVAWRLWETYEHRLRRAGVKQCYGAFFSHPQRRPEEVYARYGFRVFDRKPTTIFQPEISEVEVVCMIKELR